MIDTKHFSKCIATLELSLKHLQSTKKTNPEYEVFRNATIKGFELTLEIAGKLLRKALKIYTSNPSSVDELTYKDMFRHAAKHHLLSTEATERWFSYRDNRNYRDHDDGIALAEEILKLFPHFIDDARSLEKKIGSLQFNDFVPNL